MVGIIRCMMHVFYLDTILYFIYDITKINLVCHKILPWKTPRCVMCYPCLFSLADVGDFLFTVLTSIVSDFLNNSVEILGPRDKYHCHKTRES